MMWFEALFVGTLCVKDVKCGAEAGTTHHRALHMHIQGNRDGGGHNGEETHDPGLAGGCVAPEHLVHARCFAHTGERRARC